MEMPEREVVSQMHHTIEEGTPNQLYSKQDRICSELKSLIIFDAIGRHFHFSVFVHQFLAHLFLPLFLLLPNVSGQGFKWQWGSIWFNLFQPVLFYGMLVSYSFCSVSNRNIIGFSVFIPFFMFLAHRSLVSLKYATLSPTEYQRFNECKDKKLSDNYLNQMMLFSGWLELDSLVLYFELGAASARIGQPINRIFLLVKNENDSPAAQSLVRYWNAFLRGHDIIDCDSKPAPEMQLLPSGDFAISVYDVCLAVIRRSAGVLHVWLTISARICSFLAFCIIVVSYLPLFKNDRQMKNDVAIGFYLFTSTLLTWTFCRVYFLLLVVALFDVYRFLKMVKILHCMIRGTDLMMGLSLSVNAVVTECSMQMAVTRVDAIIAMNERIPYHSSISNYSTRDKNKKSDSLEGKNAAHKNKKSDSLEGKNAAPKQRGSAVIGNLTAEHTSCAIIPRITLDFPENALAWAYARVSIQAFGDRFRYRTDIYMMLTMLIMLFLMLLVLINLFLSENRVDAFSGAYFIQAMICVTVMVVFLLIVSSFGAAANEELALQRSTLSARGMKARARLLYRNETVCGDEDAYDEELLEKQVECVDAVLDILDVNNELRPYKFLGLTAHRAVTMSITTTALSFYSVVVSLYFSSNPAALATASSS